VWRGGSIVSIIWWPPASSAAPSGIMIDGVDEKVWGSRPTAFTST
jgi:hypothetical protein